VLLTSEGEKPTFGTVVAVGAGKKGEDGATTKPNVAVGSTVMYSKYAGTEFEVRRAPCMWHSVASQCCWYTWCTTHSCSAAILVATAPHVLIAHREIQHWQGCALVKGYETSKLGAE
jgi:hypothetical protein